MSVTVYIPTPFRRVTNNQSRVESAPTIVSELLDDLESSYPGLKGLVRDESGTVHGHINLYVNNEAIDGLDGLATRLKDGDELSIIPALAGGGAWS